ncbi:hypothetical protein BASA83_006262 [Batrachochytrium salamandrivorans]|nr:hypothetical protein BASA83_006262 [Batrachochytrium salamandrivorans]
MPFLSNRKSVSGLYHFAKGTSDGPVKDFFAVQDWPAPKKLLKKDVPFSWGPEQETSFKKLKDAFARPGF